MHIWLDIFWKICQNNQIKKRKVSFIKAVKWFWYIDIHGVKKWMKKWQIQYLVDIKCETCLH